MNTIKFKEEMKIAKDYFNHVEVSSQEELEDNIKNLLDFLHAYDFSINDVLGFYSLSDLQDEFDILRLMEYLEVTTDTSNNKLINDFIEIENPLASNKNGYLIVIDEEDEEEQY
ncbi:hypothetical protein BU104_14380 [Staphylococcus xylosus]|uniref:Uncharacterized protein n=1 Tax=Staphylococcus xylosus TaxID=1288 RepID=A0AAQ0RVQ0_STAXY|nr:hypothetical protein [Staphylococcus xylosus]MBM6639602.1 hypothetical protein [Staphylococcus xylosus]RIM90449.1 hypothetical protein BU104_14380 [Staphylococcus xylosus]